MLSAVMWAMGKAIVWLHEMFSGVRDKDEENVGCCVGDGVGSDVGVWD